MIRIILDLPNEVYERLKLRNMTVQEVISELIIVPNILMFKSKQKLPTSKNFWMKA